MKMIKVNISRKLAILICVCLSASLMGCNSSIPESYYQNHIAVAVTDKGASKIPVNFYFDNISNTEAIDINDYTSLFFERLFLTNNTQFDTTCYVRCNAGGTVNGETYEFNKYSGKINETYLSPDFYLSCDNKKTRQEAGALSQIYTSEPNNSIFDKNSVSVIFTDLSEMNLSQTAEIIRNDYLKPDYKMMMLSFSAPLKKDVEFAVARDDSEVDLRSQHSVNGVSQYRYYYLIISGPPISVASYYNALNANLTTEQKSNNKNGNKFEPFVCKSSPMFWTQHSFDNSTDLAVNMGPGGKSHTYNDKDFESATIRLREPDWPTIPEDYRSQYLEYEYDPVGKGGYTAKGRFASIDFSFNCELKMDDYVRPYTESDVAIVDKESIVPYDKNIEYDNSIIVRYAFDNLRCDFFHNGKMVCSSDMLNDSSSINTYRRKVSRFFKEFDIKDDKTISVISDNTDKSGIDSIVITADVIQNITYPNRISEWVEEQDWTAAHTSNNPIVRTAGLKKFYCTVFGISYSNTTSYTDQYQQKEVTLDPANIGMLKLVITNI